LSRRCAPASAQYTGEGLGALIREQFSPRASAGALALLFVANAGLTVSEFAGIGAAMELFGASRYVAIPLALVALWALTVFGTGGISSGSATDQGAGTLNLAGGLYNAGTAPTGTGGYVRSASPTLSGSITLTLGSDATGDIYYRNSSGFVTRLGIGSATNVLTVSGGLPTWAGAPGGGNVSNSGTPTNGQLAQWINSTQIQGYVPTNYIGGLTLSNDGGSPNTVLDIDAGSAADSTNAVMITVGAFTKSTAGAWAAGSGSNGMGNALTIASNTWYHVCVGYNAGSPDYWFDTSATCVSTSSPASRQCW